MPARALVRLPSILLRPNSGSLRLVEQRRALTSVWRPIAVHTAACAEDVVLRSISDNGQVSVLVVQGKSLVQEVGHGMPLAVPPATRPSALACPQTLLRARIAMCTGLHATQDRSHSQRRAGACAAWVLAPGLLQRRRRENARHVSRGRAAWRAAGAMPAVTFPSQSDQTWGGVAARGHMAMHGSSSVGPVV